MAEHVLRRLCVDAERLTLRNLRHIGPSQIDQRLFRPEMLETACVVRVNIRIRAEPIGFELSCIRPIERVR